MVVPVIGESGQGKSTLLNVFARKLEEKFNNSIKSWKTRARRLIETDVIDREIISHPKIPKFVLFDSLEDLSDVEVQQFLGTIKDRIRNEWFHTLVCFTTTKEFYDVIIKPAMDRSRSYWAIFKEIPELAKLKRLSPENRKEAISKWTRHLGQKLIKRQIELKELLNENALDLLVSDYSLGDALEKLNEQILKASIDQFPLDINDFIEIEKEEELKPEEISRLPKIVVIATADKNEVAKIQKGIKTRGEDFFMWRGSRLKKCKDVPKPWFIKILENLEVHYLDPDVLQKVLYHSQVFKKFKDEYEFIIKDKDLENYACPVTLQKETAEQILKESSLSGILFSDKKQHPITPAGRRQLLRTFHKNSKKSSIGIKAFMEIIRVAGFDAIEEETKRVSRIDITLPIEQEQDYALEFAFHTGKGNLKQYVAGKITTYWQEATAGSPDS